MGGRGEDTVCMLAESWGLIGKDFCYRLTPTMCNAVQPSVPCYYL
jgi:hypothetical protein